MNSLNKLLQLQLLEKLESRRLSVHSCRINDFETLDEIDFHTRYCLQKHTFELMVEYLSDKLPTSKENDALSVEEQLLVALRFYATGAFQLLIGDTFPVSQPTCSRVINRVSKCIAGQWKDFIRFPVEAEELNEVSRGFYEIAGFPGVVGAIDGTHIPIKNPGGSDAERFRGRKKFFSLNVQTISDSNLRILNVVARWPGATHDSTIFDYSSIKNLFCRQVIPANYHLLGDSGYSCETFMMTPISSPSTSKEQRYNASHVLTRNTAERSYGVVKNRFPCLEHELRCDLQIAPAIITTCCILHNIALSVGDPEPPTLFLPPVWSFDTNSQSTTRGVCAGFVKRQMLVEKFF